MPEWVSVPKGGDMLAGTMISMSAQGKRLIVYKTDSGYFATDRRCTHEAADLMRGYFDRSIIECPVHQGRFNICSGAALSAPASVPLRTYPVKVVEGQVFVEI
jgi:3-phenylpropionate/trans-cinnamate dioxygenase ferredoxin component